MGKIWYISINNTQEGPYSIKELKLDDRLTPDTLAWREGFPRWIRIRDIPELRDLFKDKEIKPEEEASKPKVPFDEVVLDYQYEPHTFFWIIIALLALLYFLYKFHVSL